MSEWKECKLGDVIKFGNGKARPKTEGDIPVYGGNGILQYSNDFNYSGETIIIGRVGAYCGSTYYEDGNIWISDNALSAKPIEKNNVKFLYYLLKKMNLNSHAQGSSHPLLTQTLLNNLEAIVPDAEEEQKAIAEILSSLDDKIDLLHRQNKTLENLAETLFRHYFIDNAASTSSPSASSGSTTDSTSSGSAVDSDSSSLSLSKGAAKDDWKEGKLGNLVDCYNGVSYKGVDLENSENALVTLKSFNRDGSFSLNGFKEYTGKYKEQHIAEEKDLIVAHTDITQDAAIIGNPILVYKPEKYKKLLFTMDTVKVKSRFTWLSNEVLYFLMKTTEFKEHCLGYSNGSTVLHLSKKAIPEFEFSLPPQEAIEKNSPFLEDCISKVFSNQKQIQTLEKLRDTLLPKLISGEVKVNYS